jgi:hypothetical protein
MKLCPICDAKINGSWCGQCHRFVTPVEYRGNIRLNESHERLHDEDCEYHGTTSVYTSEPVYKTSSTHAPVSGAKAKSEGKRTLRRTVTLIVIVYIIFAVLSILLPMLQAVNY